MDNTVNTDSTKNWIFFEDGKRDKPLFFIKARNHEEAFQNAYDYFGPQVEDLLYTNIPKYTDNIPEDAGGPYVD